MIEALGPPHTEIGRIDGPDGEWGFERLLAPGDEVRIRPPEIPLDPTKPSRLRPNPLPELRFAVDANIGRLAPLLRLLGLDTAYDRSLDDPELAELAASQGRVLLTRDTRLLKRSLVEHGRLIRAQQPREQLREVLRVYGLTPPFQLFSRCLRCNTPLEPVSKEVVLHRLEPLTRRYYDDFSRCPACDKVYWAGSHHERMLDFVGALLKKN